MAHFGNYIASVISADKHAGKDTTPASMAARMGIRHSMMSRFINDTKPHSVHPKTLERMCRGISNDPVVRAGLRIAYLKDQVGSGEDAQLIRIDLDRAARSRERDEHPIGLDYSMLSRTAYDFKLGDRTLRAIAKIIEASSRSHHFRRCVHDLGDIAEHDMKC